jgi:hypothetical protein
MKNGDTKIIKERKIRKTVRFFVLNMVKILIARKNETK